MLSRGKERNITCLPYTRDLGANSKPQVCTLTSIKLATFRCTGWHSANCAISARPGSFLPFDCEPEDPRLIFVWERGEGLNQIFLHCIFCPPNSVAALKFFFHQDLSCVESNWSQCIITSCREINGSGLSLLSLVLISVSPAYQHWDP